MDDLLERSGADFVTVVASRDEVERCDISSVLSTLNTFLATTDRVIEFRDSLDFGISGYDDDPRELYEIPEVRRFMSRLDQEFAYWFYFLTKRPGSNPLTFIALSLCRYNKVRPGIASIEGFDLSVFLERHFAAVNHLFARFCLDERENEQISRDIGFIFTGFPTRPTKQQHDGEAVLVSPFNPLAQPLLNAHAGTLRNRDARAKRTMRPDPQGIYPTHSLPYLEVVSMFLSDFGEIRAASDIPARFGAERLGDVSMTSGQRAMDDLAPRPAGFTGKVFVFRESEARRGIIDVDFRGDHLVNARIQLIFSGLLARQKSNWFYQRQLCAFIHSRIGKETFRWVPGIRSFCSTAIAGLVVAYREVPGSPSVSVGVTDERYVC